MKILSLNTHSLAEEGYEKKLILFADTIAAEKPDVMGLQEVNQTVSAPVLPKNRLIGYYPCRDFEGVIRRDNHAARLAALLAEKGVPYYWTWLPAKIGYGIYDEGMALFSRTPILDTNQFLISNASNYNNWKTRKILGILRPEGWFYTVHMGWWNDEEEPFCSQWKRADAAIKLQAKNVPNTWVMGDFNSPAEIREEGYGFVKSKGWKDTWETAQIKDEGITVDHIIDGWRDRLKGNAAGGMRIDYIWSLNTAEVKSSKVMFNGRNYPKVSDHNGVMIEVTN